MPKTTTTTDRRCGRCGETKPTADFPKDRSRPDGVANQCHNCNRSRADQQNRESYLARQIVAAHGAVQAISISREILKVAGQRLAAKARAPRRAAGAAP